MVKVMERKKVLNYLSAFAFLLLLWQAVSVILRLPVVPSPVKVFGNLSSIFFSEILIHALYSLWRIFAGIAASLLIGIPAGLCMGYFKIWDRLLSPVVYFLYPIPKIALIPVVMLLFGLGEASKIFMITLIVVFQVMVASRDAAKVIPGETFHSLYSLGAGFADIFRRAVLPASLPGLLSSVRVSLGTALSVLFFTETFGTEYGMGYFIMDSWMTVNYVDMFSGIVVLSLMGFVLFLGVDLLERLLCPWKE